MKFLVFFTTTAPLLPVTEKKATVSQDSQRKTGRFFPVFFQSFFNFKKSLSRSARPPRLLTPSAVVSFSCRLPSALLQLHVLHVEAVTSAGRMHMCLEHCRCGLQTARRSGAWGLRLLFFFFLMRAFRPATQIVFLRAAAVHFF